MAEAYCVKCKAKREVKNPQQITMKNGKPALSGLCPVCGADLNAEPEHGHEEAHGHGEAADAHVVAA